MGTNTKFNCDCGLTDEEIFDDVSSLVKLTGSESDLELEMLHQSIFHSEDYYIDDDSPTAKELETELRVEKANYGLENCPYCPPYEHDNAGLGRNNRHAKHGVQKSKYKNKNKTQGRNGKRYNGYDYDKAFINDILKRKT